MKYALILRKLIVNNTLYYQVLDKVIGEETFDEALEVRTGKNFFGQVIKSLDDLNEPIVYMEISRENYENKVPIQNIFFKVSEGELSQIDNYNEEADIALAFYNHYHDFRLIPEYNLESLIKDVKTDLQEKILGQEEVIERILAKIYSNQMYSESELSHEDIEKAKNNVLIIGPYGTGKSTILRSIKEKLDPIPVIHYQLTGNYKNDIFEIIKKLLIESNGNKYLAERGIVIFDGINSLSSPLQVDEEEVNVDLYIRTLELIMNTRNLCFYNSEHETISFDYSLITNICAIDLDYTENKESECDLYYSKINSDVLLTIGFTPDILIDLFDSEIIYMNEMTKELALKILKNKNISPLYKMKTVLENRGKTVHFSKDFIDYLVDYGLEFNEGFTGIIRTLKYLLETKKIDSKQIVFQKSDLDELRVGSAFPEIEYSEEIPKAKNNKASLEELLTVDLQKRTINELTVKDTVEIIKQNIKGQDEQIFYLVNAFYNHVFNKYRNFSDIELRELKENVLLIGSTGVGKTAIVLCLSRIFNIPFVRESATRYSKVGYVGEDVDSMLLDLLDVAKGDLRKAQNGILYIDEIDKINASNDRMNLDMSAAVQNDLLTLIEGDIRRVGRKDDLEKFEFDTSHLFVVGTGAFEGLESITKNRLKREKGQTKVGFKSEETSDTDNLNPTDEDLHEYGFDRQILGRFPNKIRLANLNEDILYEIINNQTGGVVNLNLKAYEMSGIVVSMSEDFKRALARKSLKKGSGARGINGVFLEIKREIDRNVQNGDVEQVILNGECIENPDKIIYVKRK